MLKWVSNKRNSKYCFKILKNKRIKPLIQKLPFQFAVNSQNPERNMIVTPVQGVI